MEESMVRRRMNSVFRNSRIYVAGHRGLVGSALMRSLRDSGYSHILTRSHAELDLCDAASVQNFFRQECPEYVFLAAARVGGILANTTKPVEFLAENLAVQNNVLLAARDFGVRKLLFLGSSCIYPKMCPQPIREDYLMTGPLEPTNSAYAIAKIAGIEMCRALRREYGCNFLSVMPTNLYGPNDNFDLNSSHVLPALMRKAHQAKMTREKALTVWGTGTPRREFLHVDDLAAACVYLMRHYDQEDIVNIGTGEDISIAELACLVAERVGFRGEIIFDSTKPDGTPRKLLDVSRLKALGWRPHIPLSEGIAAVYQSVDKSRWLDS